MVISRQERIVRFEEKERKRRRKLDTWISPADSVSQMCRAEER